MSYGKFWSTAEVTVPDVTGKQMTLARQILEDKKLRVNVAETYNADVPAGQVVSQNPTAGSKVKEQRLVTIYVSKGGEEIEMPDLTGLSKSDAEAQLKKMGLKLGSVYEKYSNEEAGTVIKQDEGRHENQPWPDGRHHGQQGQAEPQGQRAGCDGRLARCGKGRSAEPRPKGR